MRNIFHFFKEAKLTYNMGIKFAPFAKKIKILKYLFYKYVLKRNIPLAVIMSVTYRCQCKCKHCSIDNYRRKKHPREMDTEEIKRSIDQIASLGCVKINFFGGEPLLRKDITELVSYASGRNLFVFIDTNGFLLNKSMVNQLKNAGLSGLMVSLDSSDESRHDNLRGKKTIYRKAIEGIRYCVEEDIPCIISTIARRESIISGELERIIELARTLNATAVRILLPMLSGKWEFKEEQLLSEVELDRVFRYLNPAFIYLESGFSYQKGKVNRMFCASARKQVVYISPYGDIQLCYTFPYSFGNIKNTSFSDIVNLMWNHKLFKSIPRFSSCIMNDKNYRKIYSNNYS